MNLNLDEFKNYITQGKKKLILIAFLCLNYVGQQNDFALNIGCFWNSNGSFIMNTKIFANFIHRKENSINKNFQFNGFQNKKLTAKMIQEISNKFNFSNSINYKNWILRYCDGFNKDTDIMIIKNWMKCKYKMKSNMKKVSMPSICVDNKENEKNQSLEPSNNEESQAFHFQYETDTDENDDFILDQLDTLNFDYHSF